MTATNQNLPQEHDDRYVGGDTAYLEITVKEDDGTVKELSGADVVFALAPYPGGELLIEKDTSDDVTIVDALNGRVDVLIKPNDTAELGNSDGQQYYYEVTVRDAGGDVATVTTGTWTIYADTATV